ncbi:hypothetical protein [Noviherbaspirillum aerium]|uniref:hypothetical protein n=1 Tax=Noviherbaspirillum aerium TaxID=2588497 RepID=UPI00124DA9CA|nr:hypothetical protein [Noviherbaspirillum aerium]
MNKTVAILLALAVAGCGGSNDDNGEKAISTSPFFVEVNVPNSSSPALRVSGGSTATLTMESGQRIAFAGDGSLVAIIDNFCLSDLVNGQTSLSFVMTTDTDTTVRVQVLPPDNQPTMESAFAPPDRMRAVTLFVNVKGNPWHLANPSGSQACVSFG